MTLKSFLEESATHARALELPCFVLFLTLKILIKIRRVAVKFLRPLATHAMNIDARCGGFAIPFLFAAISGKARSS